MSEDTISRIFRCQFIVAAIVPSTQGNPYMIKSRGASTLLCIGHCSNSELLNSWTERRDHNRFCCCREQFALVCKRRWPEPWESSNTHAVFVTLKPVEEQDHENLCFPSAWACHIVIPGTQQWYCSLKIECHGLISQYILVISFSGSLILPPAPPNPIIVQS